MSRTVTERIRFHLDEHMPRAFARELRQRGIDVTTTPEAGLIQARDEVHLDFARRERRVIVTDDADFLRLAAATPDHAGVAYCDRTARTLKQIVDALLLIHGAMMPDEIIGHVEYL